LIIYPPQSPAQTSVCLGFRTIRSGLQSQPQKAKLSVPENT